MLVRLREPISGLTHLAAAVAAAIGLVALLYIGRGSSTKALSLLIYGASLVLMFAASAAYHLVDAPCPFVCAEAATRTSTSPSSAKPSRRTGSSSC